ncbi:MAG: acetyl-CoA carboxylase carboxyltransferase subunit alpha [Planctomycetota bacterium]
MADFYRLAFERDVLEIERELAAAEESAGRRDAGDVEVPALGPYSADEDPDATLEALRRRRNEALEAAYRDLTAWDIVRVARHPKRPQGRDYIERAFRDFVELRGDRRYGDDPAIVTGFARIGSHKVLIVAHHKGRTTEEKLACHFGCAHPEGYRKALAKMELAEKLGLPIVTLVDTPGAYPGVDAERRGQAEAIAVNLREMSRLKVPIVSIVIGEGGSGGALGIAVADRVAMLSHSWYSVISPEGCAAILWKQANEQTNSRAAEALKLTAPDNLRLGVVDAVIDEPLGAAHRNPGQTADAMRRWITSQLDELAGLTGEELIAARYDRFRGLGAVVEPAPEVAVVSAETTGDPTHDSEPDPGEPAPG